MEVRLLAIELIVVERDDENERRIVGASNDVEHYSNELYLRIFMLM